MDKNLYIKKLFYFIVFIGKILVIIYMFVDMKLVKYVQLLLYLNNGVEGILIFISIRNVYSQGKNKE